MATLSFEGQLYLASPYSHPNPAIRHRRYELAAQFVAMAFQHDLTIFSPIVHYHQLARKYQLPTDASFWWNTNRRHLLASAGLIILEIDGWQQSVGMMQEVEFARRHEKPILTGNLDTIENSFSLVFRNADN